MREDIGLYRGKRVDNGEWVEGDGIHYPKSINNEGSCWIDGMHEKANDWVQVIPSTVGKYIGLTAKNGKEIFTNMIVNLFGMRGVVTQECGAFGIYIKHCVDWDYLDNLIVLITGCNNHSSFCRNDNFVSFWELMWNYNQEENMCSVVEVIGNIHDNPELLEL